jgi:hypothetical protein
MRSQTEISAILGGLWERIDTAGLNTHQLRTLSALRDCRTAALGGHVDTCTVFGVVRVSYNSCRNRHCPKCQGDRRESWIDARNSELLSVPYFHVVFTLPALLNDFSLHHPKEAYGILFKSAWETLRCFASNRQVTAGMIAVLHTWGQDLSLHPHLHCIVPGGGTDRNGKWRNIRTDGKFLFPVKAMSKVFRAKYVSLLRKSGLLSQDFIEPLFSRPWTVYAKRPFAHPSHIVEYLDRYTHKVAISNSRIQSYANGRVCFSYKDYRHGGCRKLMELEDTEFIRRFALHILPPGFVRIRHYSILSSTSKKISIPCIREQLPAKEICFIDLRKIRPFNPAVCPSCGNHSMVTVEIIAARGPPEASVTETFLPETHRQHISA